MADRVMSWPVALAAVVVVIAIGASALYLDTGTQARTTSSAVSAPSTTLTTSSSQSSSQSSSGTPMLEIASFYVSHSTSFTAVTVACVSSAPAQGASYIEVTNNGTAPSVINAVAFSYVDMAQITDTGAPSGDCTVAPGATIYLVVTGIGENVATQGEQFSVSVEGSHGGEAFSVGSFG